MFTYITCVFRTFSSCESEKGFWGARKIGCTHTFCETTPASASATPRGTGCPRSCWPPGAQRRAWWRPCSRPPRTCTCARTWVSARSSSPRTKATPGRCEPWRAVGEGRVGGSNPSPFLVLAHHSSPKPVSQVGSLPFPPPTAVPTQSLLLSSASCSPSFRL